jgi:hypothetical protein
VAHRRDLLGVATNQHLALERLSAPVRDEPFVNTDGSAYEATRGAVGIDTGVDDRTG